MKTLLLFFFFCGSKKSTLNYGCSILSEYLLSYNSTNTDVKINLDFVWEKQAWDRVTFYGTAKREVNKNKKLSVPEFELGVI